MLHYNHKRRFTQCKSKCKYIELKMRSHNDIAHDQTFAWNWFRTIISCCKHVGHTILQVNTRLLTINYPVPKNL